MIIKESFCNNSVVWMLPLFKLLDKRHSTYCINIYYVKRSEMETRKISEWSGWTHVVRKIFSMPAFIKRSDLT
jgi:hypothetical protein